MGEHLRPGVTVILKSTTYPGCTEELLVPIVEKASGLRAGDDPGQAPQVPWLSEHAAPPSAVHGMDHRADHRR
ncbi:hypothetical protein [Streptomyces sp. NBC_01431]|uniref:hypothetical protein n=1 Tax=Streptomyces sp. NBC_01431 TaxID=2903863 RepID=UPI002E35E850|nr:hypothetical protein [Streptomyces sp. NBC_01431]